MESTDLAKIVMNPARIRIAQYFLVHEQGTTAQIGEELSDVPKASLYKLPPLKARRQVRLPRASL